MYIKAELHLAGYKNDGTKFVFMRGQTLKVSRRNYNIDTGIEIITGKLESIISSTNELRLDISDSLKSEYVTIAFGEITDIAVVHNEETIPDDTEVSFDYGTKKNINVVIPALLRQIIATLPECKCNYSED